jgi:uncharacterized protein involved in tolerance to divalent cations
MATTDPAVVILAAVPNDEIATDITDALLLEGLIAFSQCWPGITTTQMWGKETHSDTEVGLLLFTRASLADRAIAKALTYFQYGTGPFVVIDVSGGHGRFLEWIASQTSRPST